LHCLPIFKDAKEKDMPEDEHLLETAKTGIEQLNKKYNRYVNDIFFLFHRPRKWNAKEKVWMGYERKRGKLTELNQLLRGNAAENFSLIVGEEDVYKKCKIYNYSRLRYAIAARCSMEVGRRNGASIKPCYIQ